MKFKMLSMEELEKNYNQTLQEYLKSKGVESVDKIPNPDRRQEWASVGAVFKILDQLNTLKKSNRNIETLKKDINQRKIVTGFLLELSSTVSSYFRQASTVPLLLKIGGLENEKLSDGDRLELNKALDGFMEIAVHKMTDNDPEWRESAQPLQKAVTFEFLQKLMESFTKRKSQLEIEVRKNIPNYSDSASRKYSLFLPSEKVTSKQDESKQADTTATQLPI